MPCLASGNSNEFFGSCIHFTAWHADLPDNENCPCTPVTTDIRVCVPGLPVQGLGLGGQCAVDGGRRHRKEDEAGETLPERTDG